MNLASIATNLAIESEDAVEKKRKKKIIFMKKHSKISKIIHVLKKSHNFFLAFDISQAYSEYQVFCRYLYIEM